MLLKGAYECPRLKQSCCSSIEDGTPFFETSIFSANCFQVISGEAATRKPAGSGIEHTLLVDIPTLARAYPLGEALAVRRPFRKLAPEIESVHGKCPNQH